jgi:hypothetical protein
MTGAGGGTWPPDLKSVESDAYESEVTGRERGARA